MDWWSAIALVVSFALGAALHRTLDVPALRRTNYRGSVIPTGGGIVAVFAFIVVRSGFVMASGHAGRGHVASAELIAVAGFGGLGFFDDVVGTHSARGLRGHIAAATRGQLTSGATKLLVGLCLAAAIAPSFSLNGWHRLLIVVLIAGAANAANLFDLAPGRTAKLAALVLAGLAVWVGTHLALSHGPLWFFAAVAGLLPFELRERLMLGDAGANALGAVVGIATVRACGGNTGALVVAAAVVAAINLAGELVSFSVVIERTPPLRALDRLGRIK